MEADALIAGHVNGAAEVQRGVEHSQRFVFRHVDLIQHAEAAQFRALVDGALAQGDGAVGKGVRTQQGGGVGVDVEGHIPAGTGEGGGQIFRQDVFAGGLGADQQQVLAAQQGRGRLFPDILAVIEIPGLGNPAGQFSVDGEFGPEGFDFVNDAQADALASQEFQHCVIPPRTAEFMVVFTVCDE